MVLKLIYTTFIVSRPNYPMLMRLFLILLMLLTAELRAQSLTIGIVAYDPPFSMNADKNHFFGFDIELMSELCKQISVQCHFEPMLFDALFTDINEGKIDLAIAAITITNERQQKFLFSLPYLASEARFVTTKNSLIKTLKKLNNKTIGIIKGSLFKQLITQKFKTNLIKEYPSTNQLITALNQQEVDALLMDDFSADYWIANNNTLFKGIGRPFSVGIGYGIMAKINSIVLMNQINQALKHLEKNGVYLSLYQKYFHNIPMH
ncbi:MULTISPECIES: transporter substrate-binding domain-containing protein [Legionella]|uniref:Arginine transport system periplasmic binding protein n=1 Tax=Legionella waltersii TaxID=66969 RepID=A0A0W1A2J5_9GAMM|nr:MULTISPECIES: transporter substrate-binding domain-containing protein [Legionella]KTD75235.1 arginine transport system periplasmic binding protein [Legionella waltersii]MCZ4798815.1 transporter substrate-binding domain-containing protein [Legionella pneumophila]SNU96064.1 arginine transport system substrate-binding protein [Legionella waltersii]